MSLKDVELKQKHVLFLLSLNNWTHSKIKLKLSLPLGFHHRVSARHTRENPCLVSNT